jgi:formiminotetrahydrofolate cyclodeaminase
MSFENDSIEGFCASLASAAPTPGGGTASAAAGALGAALVSMVCELTLSKEKYRDAHEALAPIAAEAKEAGEELRRLMTEDAEAFEGIARARKMPKVTEAEQAARLAAIQAASRLAADVPMRTARAATDLLDRVPLLAEKGNPNAISDAGVAALLLSAAAEGALLNVSINLPGIEDGGFVAEMERKTAELSREIERLRAQSIQLVRKTFGK